MACEAYYTVYDASLDYLFYNLPVIVLMKHKLIL